MMQKAKLMEQKQKQTHVLLSKHIIQIKKQRNSSPQIWIKRNAMKKLAIHSKFNKYPNATLQESRKQIIAQGNKFKQGNFMKDTIQKYVLSKKTTSQNKSVMQKPMRTKAQNLTKHTQNFFTSNLFSINGIKSYYKSSFQQGNNFINLSRALISNKNSPQKVKRLDSCTKPSISQRQRCQDNIRYYSNTKRSFSNYENHGTLKIGQNCKIKDFLKITTKELHLNYSNDLTQSDHNSPTNNNRIFSNRAKTQANQRQNQTKNETKNRIKNVIQIKISTKRPQTCTVKGKRSHSFSKSKPDQEFSYNEGWDNKQIQIQHQPFQCF